jgi:hypothetical protein
MRDAHQSVSTPEVTVLMSVCNGSKYLGQAIESVLSQTFHNFEFLIVDDGSTDGSSRLIQSFADPRIRLVNNSTNIGLTKSLNRGLRLARGSLIARHDADDISHSTRLAKQVACLDEHPEIALVGTQFRVIDELGRVIQEIGDYRAQSQFALEWQLLLGNPFTHSTVMFRNDIVLNALGGYDEGFEYNQDFELWSRLLAQYRATNLPEALLDYRVHADSMGGRRGPAVLEGARQRVIRNREIQRRNIRRVIGSESLAEKWPKLWMTFTVTWVVGEGDTPSLVPSVLDELWKEFLKQRPGASNNAEVQAVLAMTLAYIACHLASRDRGAAIGAFVRYLRAGGRHFTGIAPRFLALLLLGRRGRRIVHSLKSFLGVSRA